MAIGCRFWESKLKTPKKPVRAVYSHARNHIMIFVGGVINLLSIMDDFFLLEEECEYFSTPYFPDAMLYELDIESIDELLEENIQEVQNISTFLKWEVYKFCPEFESYDEAEQLLVGASYNIHLMRDFLKKSEYIQKLVKIRKGKIAESQIRERGESYVSENQMKELIASKNIIEVVEKYAWWALSSRHSKSHNIKCPLKGHEDNKPSLHIYPETNSFYCYGCNRGWGIVQFMKHLKWISDKEAFKELFPQ